MKMQMFTRKIENLVETLEDAEEEIDDPDLEKRLLKSRRLFQKRLNYHYGRLKGEENKNE